MLISQATFQLRVSSFFKTTRQDRQSASNNANKQFKEKQYELDSKKNGR